MADPRARRPPASPVVLVYRPWPMTFSLEITIDAVDAERTAAFWAAALGYSIGHRRDPYVVLVPPAGVRAPEVLIQRVPERAPGKSPVHLDLRFDDPASEIERLVGLGATVVGEVDERPLGGAAWTVLADPEGTPFCVCPARTSD